MTAGRECVNPRTTAVALVILDKPIEVNIRQAFDRMIAVLPVSAHDVQPVGWDHFFAGWHSIVGLASRTDWTYSPDIDPGPGWLLIVVARRKTAKFLVRRDDDPPGRWVGVPNDQAPWFALSTAGSLRQALDGVPLPPIKAVGDRRLFDPPAAQPHPPVDEHGRL